MKTILLILAVLLLFVAPSSAQRQVSVELTSNETPKSGSKTLTDAILTDLLDMGIITDKAKASFLLEKGRFIVNDEWQDTETVRSFVKKYKISDSSTWIAYNYSM